MGWSTNHPNGLIYYSPQRAYRGYTLITNVSGHDARLIDMEGRVCHTWHSGEGIGYAYLLPNGNLLLRTGPAAEEVSFLSRPERELLPRGGRTVAGAILELDWDSNVVWEYRYPFLHHDFERLPNGNTLVLTWELMPDEVTRQVKGGHESEGDHRGMLGDSVREVTPAGEVVYEWNSWEHLDLEEDRICFLEGREEWTHQNTLNVTPEGDLVVSFRQTDTVGIVDRATGKFRWKWGPGNISHQHNPTMLDNGRVLIFDNGPHKWVGGHTFEHEFDLPMTVNRHYSAKAVVEPKADKSQEGPPNLSLRQLKLKPPSQRMAKGPKRPGSLPTNARNVTERRQPNAA